MFEPFMPSFSAKVYQQMAITRTATHEKIFQHVKEDFSRVSTLVASGHQIGEPKPIFREIKDDEIEKWKLMFGGEKLGA